jgi:hypothetical protein
MLKVCPTKSLSFDELIPGNSVRVTGDNMVYAVDLTMVITGKNRNDAGQVLRRLPEENFSSNKMTERNTGGQGNGRTKLVTFDDALELIMVLPGNMAKGDGLFKEKTRSNGGRMACRFPEITRRALAALKGKDQADILLNRQMELLRRIVLLETWTSTTTGNTHGVLQGRPTFRGLYQDGYIHTASPSPVACTPTTAS